MRVTTLTLFICCFVSAEHRQLPVGKIRLQAHRTSLPNHTGWRSLVPCR